MATYTYHIIHHIPSVFMQSFLFWGSPRSFVPPVHYLLPLLTLAFIFRVGLVKLLFVLALVALLVNVYLCCLAHPFLLPVQIPCECLDIGNNLLRLHLCQTFQDLLLAVLHFYEYLPVSLMDMVRLIVIDLDEVLPDLLDHLHSLPLHVLLLVDIKVDSQQIVGVLSDKSGTYSLI